MEVEITALVCKTNARTYEVPISYYGRSYEEGKKIGLLDGLAALWYLGYYNLVKSRFGAGRHYVRAVNAYLDQRSGSPHPSTANDPAGSPADAPPALGRSPATGMVL